MRWSRAGKSYALPGQVDSIASEGCHDLIRDGVTLVRGVDDVLSTLGPLPMPTSPNSAVTSRSRRELVLNPLESQVLNLVSARPVCASDNILREAAIETSRVLATLTVP